jgi:uncharacterized protein YbjT (DUF2867 family)
MTTNRRRSGENEPGDGPVLVTGATGRQGGAVVTHLLQAGIPVRALCRDPAAARARHLRDRGVQVVPGDMDDAASLTAALAGAAGVFSVQNYWDPAVGYAGEVRQARTLAEAAHRAGVQLFVQSTMAAADEDAAPLPAHFLSKRRIEAVIDDIGLPRTFVGTVFFMDNVGDKAMGGPLLLPMLAGTLGRDTPLQMVAVTDIGRAATAAFASPARFAGTRLDVVGDTLTVPQMRAVHGRTGARRAPAWALPTAASRVVNHEFTAQLEWQVRAGFTTSPSEARLQVPGLQDYEQHLRSRQPSPSDRSARGQAVAA